MVDRSSIPYEELRIVFSDSTPDGFPFKCTSLSGEVDGMFRIPITQEEAEQALASVARFTKNYVQRGVPRESIDPVQQTGTRLFNALFVGAMADIYRTAVERSTSTGGGLRLRFAMRASELKRLPWEFLYDDKRPDFVFLSAQIALVRESEAQTARSFDVAVSSPDSPIRVLIVTAAVIQSIASGLDEEIALLGKLEERSLIKLRVVKNAVPADFISAVENGDYEVIMFSGTADEVVDKSAETKSQSFAMMSPNSGEKVELRGEHLIKLLAGQKNLKLLYLSAGQTELLAEYFSGFVPVTVGMRGLVTDRGCIAFTEALFKNAIEGQWFDAAISHGRRAIDLGDPGTREWGMPVCYTSVPDGLRLRAPRQEQAVIAASPPIIETADAGIIARVKVRRKSPSVNEGQKRRLGELETLLTVQAQNLTELKKQAAVYKAPPDFLDSQVKETEAKSDEIREKIEEEILKSQVKETEAKSDEPRKKAEKEII